MSIFFFDLLQDFFDGKLFKRYFPAVVLFGPPLSGSGIPILFVAGLQRAIEYVLSLPGEILQEVLGGRKEAFSETEDEGVFLEKGDEVFEVLELVKEIEQMLGSQPSVAG